MATMDIIKLAEASRRTFLMSEVGFAGASRSCVRILLADQNVKAVLINLRRIVRCDMVARGVVEAAKTSESKFLLWYVWKELTWRRASA